MVTQRYRNGIERPSILVFIHNSLADLWDELGNGVTWNSEAIWEARIAVTRGQVSEGYSNIEAWFKGFSPVCIL